ncbi:MAG: nuclear transport factor 2 family protein [Pseudomonadales bacterium]|nr:nuclear transport factor 2 family protein [Pseudomonadales bacterium]
MSNQRQILNKTSLDIRPGLPLQASSGGIEELRADIQRLMDMEAIRQLKYAYFRCVDTANLEELVTLLHDDLSVHYIGGSYEWKMQGRQEFVAAIGMAFTKQAVGQHNAHHPEIQMLSATEATALWYLADNMWILNHGRRRPAPRCTATAT